MNNTQQEEKKGCGWYIGYAISFVIFRFLRRVWDGIVEASKKIKWLPFVYIGLVVTMILELLIFYECWFMGIVTVLTAFSFGIWNNIKEKPMREKREYFDNLFTTLKFTAPDGSLPYYLGENNISEYVTTHCFATLMPLNLWFKIKDHLEMQLNVKILDITQDERNNRVINVLIKTGNLQEYIDWTDYYISDENALNIGMGYSGVVGMDLEKYPHAFIAGDTGSGKSNILKCMIHQALIKDYDVVLIDFKRGVSFSDFIDEVDVVYEYPEALKVLKALVEETKNRLDLFRKARVDNINDYNHFANNYLNRKIVFIDELAELLVSPDKETSKAINDCIVTLTRLSRAVGINLIMGIQRPGSDVISGQIKSNVSYRVCGYYPDGPVSEIVLGNRMASELPRISGRFIIKDNDFKEVQCFFFDKMHNRKRPPEALLSSDYGYIDDDEYIDTDIDDDVTEDEIEQDTEAFEIEEPEPTTASDFDFDFSDFEE